MRRLILGLLLISSAGCVSLKSVSATSRLGENLAEHERTLAQFSHNCRLLVAAQLASRCPAHAEKWQKTLLMLADYGRKLGALAETDEPSIEDELNVSLNQARAARWTSLAQEQDRAIAETAQKIAAFVTQEYSRAELGHALRQVHAPLITLVGLLVQHLKTQREQLQILQCQVSCAAGTPLPAQLCPDTPASACGTPDDPAVAFSMTSLLAELERQAIEIDRAERAILAFGRAHGRLHDNAAKLGDPAVYKQILADVAAIHGAAKPAL